MKEQSVRKTKTIHMTGTKRFSIWLCLFLLTSPLAFGQCRSQIWRSTKDSTVPARFQSLLPSGMAGRFAVHLNSGDWLIVYAKPGIHTADDPQDGGFLLVRGHHVLVSQSLMNLPAWKKFARDIGSPGTPAFGVFAAQVCASGEKPIIFLGFAACCTTASAVQYFLMQQAGTGYGLKILPMVGGGKLEIIDSTPIRLKLWDETGDGKCDGCLQHFQVSEYEMRNGKPVLVRKQKTSGEYKPGDFDSHRIVLVH